MSLWSVLVDETAAWPGVSIGKTRFGSAPALLVAGREFAHEHSASEVDVRVPRSAQTPYLALRPGTPARRANWIALEATSEDAERAVLEAVCLAYEAHR